MVLPVAANKCRDGFASRENFPLLARLCLPVFRIFGNRRVTNLKHTIEQNATDMNTNCSKCDLHRFPEKRKPASNDAEKKEKNLERAIVIGALLILALVAVVFYLKFAALGLAANSPTLEIQSIARY